MNNVLPNEIARHKLAISLTLGLLLLICLIYVVIIKDLSIYLLLAAAMLILSLFIIVLKPWFGTYLVVASFPFLSSLSRGVLGVPVLKPDELLIIIFFIFSLIPSNHNGKFTFSNIDISYWIVIGCSILATLAQLIYADENLNWFQISSILKPYFLYRLIVTTINEKKKLDTVIYLLLGSSFIVSIIAILQLLDIGSMRNFLATIYPNTSASYLIGSNYAYQSSKYLRATSTLGDWNALGGYSVMVFLLSLCLLSYKNSLSKYWLIILGLVSSVVSLVLTGSLNSIGGMIIGYIVWLIIRKKQKRNSTRIYQSALILLILIALIMTLGGEVLENQITRQLSTPYTLDRTTNKIYPTYGLPESLVLRWLLYTYIIGLVTDNIYTFLAGYGRGTFGMQFLPWGTTEGGYVSMIYFYGSIFLIGYFLLYRQIMRLSIIIKKMVEEHEELSASIASSVICITGAVIVMNLVHSYYVSAGVVHMYWIILGCMIASYQILLKKVPITT